MNKYKITLLFPLIIFLISCGNSSISNSSVTTTSITSEVATSSISEVTTSDEEKKTSIESISSVDIEKKINVNFNNNQLNIDETDDISITIDEETSDNYKFDQNNLIIGNDKNGVFCFQTNYNIKYLNIYGEFQSKMEVAVINKFGVKAFYDLQSYDGYKCIDLSSKSFITNHISIEGSNLSISKLEINFKNN